MKRKSTILNQQSIKASFFSWLTSQFTVTHHKNWIIYKTRMHALHSTTTSPSIALTWTKRRLTAVRLKLFFYCFHMTYIGKAFDGEETLKKNITRFETITTKHTKFIERRLAHTIILYLCMHLLPPRTRCRWHVCDDNTIRPYHSNCVL